MNSRAKEDGGIIDEIRGVLGQIQQHKIEIQPNNTALIQETQFKKIIHLMYEIHKHKKCVG